MNVPAFPPPSLVEVSHVLAPGGDPVRQAIQSDLYYTQFYKGRTDGLPDDERMDAAIRLVQISARLPVTGTYNDDVHQAILRFRRTSDFQDKPTPTLPPIAVQTPPEPSAVGGFIDRFGQPATIGLLLAGIGGLALAIGPRGIRGQKTWTPVQKAEWAVAITLGLVVATSESKPR